MCVQSLNRDLYPSNAAAIASTVRHLIETVQENRLMFPGHGIELTMRQAKIGLKIRSIPSPGRPFDRLKISPYDEKVDFQRQAFSRAVPTRLQDGPFRACCPLVQW